MNAKYFAALTTIILVMGLSQPVTHAQVQESVMTSMLNDVFVHSTSQSQEKDSELPLPPDRGTPGDRKGASSPGGTR